MVTKVSLMAALAATTILASGVAFAEPQSAPSGGQTAQQATAVKDFGKLSADGSRAYQDLVLTRLAIFDGRIADAKKDIADADSSFDKAQNDQTVFTKAEADMKVPGDKGQQASDDQDAGKTPAGSEKTAATEQADMKTPKQWLPVDGEISINEDYSANKAKADAVANANKSLAKGDRQGALETLKLANIDMNVVLAVVPVKQTVQDVHQAATLINDGKYYEASQLLRQVQDSTRFDVAVIDAVPNKGAMTGSAAKTGSTSGTEKGADAAPSK